MATDSEIRAWAREQGVEVTARGRVGPDTKAAYAEAHPQGGPPAGDDDWDLGEGAGELFDDTIGADELEPSVPMQPERPPRTAKASRKAARSRPVGERLFGKRDPKPAAKKVKHRRVPVDHLVGRVWEGLARFAQPLSMPMSRCLQVQSPVAGMLLEDIVAGTVVDRVLQPVARAEQKAEKALALIGPPVLVLALEQTQFMEPQQAAMRQAIIVPMLRESLRIWLQVAGPKVEEAARREAEYQEKFGHTIDELIAMFMGAVPDGETVTVQEPEMAGASA